MSKRNLFYLAMTFFLSIGSSAYAEWVAMGPAGTDAQSLFCSPNDSDAAHVGTNGGDYKTTDLGNSWAYKVLRFRGVNIVGSRQGCGLGLFASGWNDIFNSTNGGDTWSLYATLPDDVEALVRSYPPSCVGYAGTQNGVFVSNGNRGLSGIGINALAVDSANKVYAATGEKGIYRTDDNGLTWTQITSGLSTLNVQALKIDNSDRLFAATIGGGVFFSNDAGENWMPKNNGLQNIDGYPGVYVVSAIEKDYDGTLYAGVYTNLIPLSGAVYKSSDNGDNWSPTDGSINNYSAKSMCVTLGNKLFVGTNHGVFRTDDKGATWVDLTDGISAMEFTNTFAMDSEGTIFAGSGNSGAYKSIDGGSSWVHSGNIYGTEINALLADNLNNMYASSSGSINGVFKSTDRGETWVLSSNGLPTKTQLGMVFFEEGHSLAIDGNGRIYVGLDNGAIYKTDDHASSWSGTAALPFADDPPEIVALLGNTGSTIYAGTKGEGVFKSVDGGSTWVKKNNGLPADVEVQENAFSLDKAHGDIYVGLQSGLYKSSNGGDSWTNIVPSPDCDVGSVTMDDNGNLWAVVCSTAVYVSRDRGATWLNMSADLVPWDDVNGINLRGIFTDGKDHLLLSTRSSGIYRLRMFNDVPGTHWAIIHILAIFNAGITTGCGNGNYCPENPVTRAQMAVFIIKEQYGSEPMCNGNVLCKNTLPYFTDVPSNHWAFKFIQKMKETGITAGCGSGVYCPDDSVTRAQMAVFVTKALNQTPSATCLGTVFNDVNDGMNGGAGFCRYIEKFKELNITAGCGNGNYCPDDQVTRAQMAVFLTKAFLE